MNFIDTDIFVIDKLFPQDNRYKINRQFLKLVESDDMEGCTSIYNLFELLGIASYNLNEPELKKLLEGFEDAYNIKIIYPEMTFDSAGDFLERFFNEAFKKICMKMNFQDAVILNIAEDNLSLNFITWNLKHFKNKTFLEVLTPEELLQK